MEKYRQFKYNKDKKVKGSIMKKKEYPEAVSKKVGISKKDTLLVLNAMIETL